MQTKIFYSCQMHINSTWPSDDNVGHYKPENFETDILMGFDA